MLSRMDAVSCRRETAVSPSPRWQSGRREGCAAEWRSWRQRAAAKHPPLPAERAIQPSVALQPRRARFHVVLRIEVGSCRVRRAGSLNDRQHLAIPQRLQGLQCGIQSEAAVQIDGRRRTIRARRARGSRSWGGARSSASRRTAPPCSIRRRRHAEKSPPGSCVCPRGRSGASQPERNRTCPSHHHGRSAQEKPPCQHSFTSSEIRAN